MLLPPKDPYSRDLRDSGKRASATSANWQLSPPLTVHAVEIKLTIQ